MPELTPVRQTEREVFMDVLRGFAILGIFIANLNSFSFYDPSIPPDGSYLLGKADHSMSFLHHMLIEGKFYSIFSLLFGWGIALQFKRAAAKGVNALPTIRRRLLFMLLLGAVHLMIWPGDIVFFYGLVAFLLLPLRKFSNKTLLITGTVLVLLPILLYWLKMTYPVLNYPSQKLANAGEWTSNELFPQYKEVDTREEFAAITKDLTWFDFWKNNLVGFFYRYSYLFHVSRVPKVLGMFLIGYVIGRSDFFKNLDQHRKLVYTVIVAGLLVGLPANYLLAKQMQDHMGDYFAMKQNGLYQTTWYALGVAPLALAYVGLLMLAFKSTTGNRLLSVLSPVGKMAFTNYIMQSLIGNFVFFSAGLNYMWKVGPVYYTLFGVIVFILQIILSTIWLKYFNYGPVEWLWRSATYKKWQPMRRRGESK